MRPNIETRSADAIGCAVSVARITTSEDTRYVSQSCRKSGVEDAKALLKLVSVERRSETATRATRSRWQERRA